MANLIVGSSYSVVLKNGVTYEGRISHANDNFICVEVVSDDTLTWVKDTHMVYRNQIDTIEPKPSIIPDDHPCGGHDTHNIIAREAIALRESLRINPDVTNEVQQVFDRLSQRHPYVSWDGMDITIEPSHIRIPPPYTVDSVDGPHGIPLRRVRNILEGVRNELNLSP